MACDYSLTCILDACIMNGKSYTQGQQWDDGCKQICVCDDGATGHYTCRSRSALILRELDGGGHF